MVKTRILLLPILLLILAGCSNRAVQAPHPNQLDQLDGAAYDVLTTAQAALNEAKVQQAAGKLPASSKDVINGAIAVYNSTQQAWHTYRSVKQGTQSGDLTQLAPQLQALVSQLQASVATLQQLTGGK